LDFVIRNFNKGESMEKKPYKKPALTKIKLVAEEAVLGVCKNSNDSGANQPQCVVPQCFNEGS